MSETSKARNTMIAAVIWLAIIALAIVGYRYWWIPHSKERLVKKTSASASYRYEATLAADGFSGYAFLRSDTFAKFLKAEGIKLTVEDDKADYSKRMQRLRDGKIQFAVFTVDAFLKAGAEIGEFPATMIAVIDETKGADAIVSYKSAVPSIESLNSPSAKYVLTPNSPSEFLGRVTNASFNLPLLPEKWFEPATGAGDVYEKLKRADKSAKRAYILWEPYVTQALQDPNVQVLLDSSRLKGYIVDVIVVERNYLREHQNIAETVIEAYLKTAQSFQDNPVGLTELVQADAQTFGDSLTPATAQKVVNGIQWKSTSENYGHFGLLSAGLAGSVENLEDIVPKIAKVLIQTNAVGSDPTSGKPTSIFYPGILKALQAKGFHPGKKVDVLQGAGLGNADLAPPRTDAPLPTIGSTNWSSLREVGSLRIQPISFTRGTATMSVQSKRDLDELAHKLKSFPAYYIRVAGTTRAEGDLTANRALAQARADAATRYLVGRGVSASRIRAEAVPNSGSMAQEVSFLVMEKP